MKRPRRVEEDIFFTVACSMRRIGTAVDDRDKKLLEAVGAVFQLKGITGTPKAFVESILNDVKTLNEALS